ncbi:hypothetical protein KM043_006674 [Ampulex compressa]|nr:hypothetical protein KM043_006674 [Ampulex compressa]
MGGKGAESMGTNRCAEERNGLGKGRVVGEAEKEKSAIGGSKAEGRRDVLSQPHSCPLLARSFQYRCAYTYVMPTARTGGARSRGQPKLLRMGRIDDVWRPIGGETKGRGRSAHGPSSYPPRLFSVNSELAEARP